MPDLDSNANGTAQAEDFRDDIYWLSKERDRLKDQINRLRQQHIETLRKMEALEGAIDARRNSLPSAGEITTVADMIADKDLDLRVVNRKSKSPLSSDFRKYLSGTHRLLRFLASAPWIMREVQQLALMTECEVRGSHRMDEEYSQCLDCKMRTEDIARRVAIYRKRTGNKIPLRWTDFCDHDIDPHTHVCMLCGMTKREVHSEHSPFKDEK